MSGFENQDEYEGSLPESGVSAEQPEAANVVTIGGSSQADERIDVEERSTPERQEPEQESDGNRGKGDEDGTSSSSGLFNDPDPWREPVQLQELLDEIVSYIRMHVVVTQAQAYTMALWVLAAHAHSAARISPILTIQSPEKRCGKTTLLGVLECLLPRALSTSHITPAAIFRTVEKYHPTLLIDEADTFIHTSTDMWGILNSGHTKHGARVIRLTGEGHDPKPFSTWCPKVVALIGKLPSTLEDRSIVIRLERKLKTDLVAKFNDGARAKGRELMAKAMRYIQDHEIELTAMEPCEDHDLDDRAADNWELMFKIATLAGDKWIERAKAAATIITASSADAKLSDGERLLADIRKVFDSGGFDEIGSKGLSAKLNSDEQSVWRTQREGRGLSTRGIAQLLRPFGISPRKQRDHNVYRRADFEEAWERYLTQS
ncbi:MAG: hypothetical protein RLZ98_3121 [Pseudomonadota bacterium]